MKRAKAFFCNHPPRFQAGRMAAVGQQHFGPEAVKDLPGQCEEDVRLRRSGDRSARLEAVGMTVTRTPLTVRSTTSAGSPVASSAWNR